MITAFAAMGLALASGMALAKPAVGESESALSMQMKVASALANGALGKIGGDAMGWVMGELGLSSDPDQKILQQLSQIESRLDAIEAALTTVEQGVIGVYKQEVKNEAQSLLNDLNTAVADIEPSWTVYRQIVKNKTGDAQQMSALATQITTNVPAALDTIDQLMTANGSGSTGLVEVYAQVISNAVTSPTVGDTNYYSQLHGAMAYYNQWRMNAIVMLVEAYHYQALQGAAGATAKSVCTAPTVASVKLNCDLAAHYANRFFNPSTANPQSGVIYQLQLAGASVTNSAATSLTVPGTSNGVPSVNVWLWSSTLSSAAIPPTYPDGTSPFFNWDPPPIAWTFDGAPAGADANGFQTWRSATYADMSALLSAYSGTAGTAMAANFPAVANEKFIALGSDVYPVIPEPESSNENCYIRFVNMAVPAAQAIGCGAFILNGGNYLDVQGPFGPYLNQSCNQFGQCDGGNIGWSWNGMANTTPQGKQWAVTDANGCPSGQSSTNAAGWLKPCGDAWVQQRYQQVLPSSATTRALAAASQRIQTMRK